MPPWSPSSRATATSAPPCANELVEAGIAWVVYAVADPNPKAVGGTERLRAVGTEDERGVLEAEAERINQVWLTAMRLGRPFVAWRYAASLDGPSRDRGWLHLLYHQH
ncbi:MAG: hypothetical protein ACRDYX_22560 [Egibacteraceae bacterium]